MNILCEKTLLIEGINTCLKAIPSKSTMTILECIVIDVKDGSIKLISNDLELGIETIVKGRILEEGSVAVNAKVFYEIVRKLPSDEVIVSTTEIDNFSNINVEDNEEILNIIGGKSNFQIGVKSTENFPYLPNIVKENSIQISQFTLKEVIQQTVFSISNNESTKVMSGELFEVKKNQLRVISLDGHRISIRKVTLKEEYDDISVIIPGKTLIEISKIIGGGLDDEVNMYFTNKHVLFEFEDTLVLSRLIEGEYYMVDKMISNDYETMIKVNKQEMLECIDRTTLMIRESEKKPVIIDVKDGSMEFAVKSGIGSMAEDIEIQKEGKDILIGFNPRFLMDALRVIDDEEITLYMINPKAPCFIRNNEETYIYLILPVNFTV